MKNLVGIIAVIGLMCCVSGLDACENCGLRTVRVRRARLRVRVVRPVVAVEVAPVEAVVVETAPVVVEAAPVLVAPVIRPRIWRRPLLWIR